MQEAGLAIFPGKHLIVPVMPGDTVLAQKTSKNLLEFGAYAAGFSIWRYQKVRQEFDTDFSSTYKGRLR